MSWKDVPYVQQLLSEYTSFPALTNYLQECWPGERGLSLRSVKRFCKDNNISSRRSEVVAEPQLAAGVANAVKEVGASYGRRMMKAYLSTKGINAADKRVRQQLKKVQPVYHAKRLTRTHRLLNPCSYYAPYWGFALHMDQNEKLAEFGVTFIMAIDGKSNFVVGAAVMPIKNNKSIYRLVFRAAVEKYGLWEQVIVDSGREFFLTLYMQHYLRDRCQSSCTRAPYKQVPSVKNNRIERAWGEINQRIGFPIKQGLIDLQNDGFDMSLSFNRFAASTVAIAVAQHGLAIWVPTWNRHHISKRGTPESHMSESRCLPFLQNDLLSVDDAVRLYETQGTLSDEKFVGEDIVVGDDQSKQRDQEFWTNATSDIGDVGFIFGEACNFNYLPLQDAIKLFVRVSNNYV